MWAHDILSQLGSTIKRASSPTVINGHLISKIRSKSVRHITKCEKQNLEAVAKELSGELVHH